MPILPTAATGPGQRGSHPEPARPIVIAHRGASGHLPEHTLAAYALAIELGADFVEPDLVSTADGVLIARHENEISGTTDVDAHPEFASRRTTRVVDGVPTTGWFAEDFTLAEFRTLRARERLPQVRPANAVHDGRYGIPTLGEVIELVRSESSRRGRPIGIYPETKHPTYFDSIGLSLEEPLVEALVAGSLGGSDVPVFIQSFEVGNLMELAAMTRLPLVQLLDAGRGPYDLAATGAPRTYADMATPGGLASVAAYAAGIGVHRDLVIPLDASGSLGRPTSLVRDAHAAGLVVHAWTFRAENVFLPANLRRGDPADPGYLAERGDWAADYAAFFATGLDGVFSDQPELAVAARDAGAP